MTCIAVWLTWYLIAWSPTPGHAPTIVAKFPTEARCWDAQVTLLQPLRDGLQHDAQVALPDARSAAR